VDTLNAWLEQTGLSCFVEGELLSTALATDNPYLKTDVCTYVFYVYMYIYACIFACIFLLMIFYAISLHANYCTLDFKALYFRISSVFEIIIIFA